MSTTFTLSSDLLPRLAQLHLATDTQHRQPALAHIHLQVTTQRVRFTASDGRLLAVLVGDITEHRGITTDVLLDGDQFARAVKTLSKVSSATGSVRVTIDVGEVRFHRNLTSALVRRVPITYPVIDHVITKPEGMRWVPCASSLDQPLAEVARKISGKPVLLFLTPVPMVSLAADLWKPVSLDGAQATVHIADLRPLMNGPAYWSDGSGLLLMIMPVTRTDMNPQLDLSPFILKAAQAVAVAA